MKRKSQPCLDDPGTMTPVTAKGTPIARWGKAGVGKRIGKHLYVHRNYVEQVLLSGAFPRVHYEAVTKGERFRCVRLYMGPPWSIRMDEAPDFDTAREPKVGNWLEWYDEDVGWPQGHSDAIWHHKWLWVGEDYKGFDVKAARLWSATYVPLLTSPPKASLATWEAQLKGVGLA